MAVKKFLSGEEFSHFFLLSVQTLLPETLFVFVSYEATNWAKSVIRWQTFI